MNQTLTEQPGTTRAVWPELLTPEEAATVLEADVRAVLNAVDAGSLSALRLGTYVRIPRRALATAPRLER